MYAWIFRGKVYAWCAVPRGSLSEKLPAKLMHIALEAGQGFNAHPACPRQLLAPLLYRHDGLVWPACLQFVQADLQARRPELVAKSDDRRYLEAAQYASVARQLLNYHAALARQSGERIVRLLGIHPRWATTGRCEHRLQAVTSS